MTKQIDLNKYQDFVQAVTSTESNMPSSMIDRILELDKETDVNLSLLMTAAIGLAAECGEFAELPKKSIIPR